MSAETINPTNQEAEPTFQESISLVTDNLPTSVESALENVQYAREALPAAMTALQNGEITDSTTVQKLAAMSDSGLNYYRLTPAQEQQDQDVTKGGRPAELAGLSDKEWYNVGRTDREAYRSGARSRLSLNEKIGAYEQQQAHQTKVENAHGQAIEMQEQADSEMQDHIRGVSDAAYDAKKAEMEADITARLEKARSNPHLNETARNTVVSAIEEEWESSAAVAADTAASERQQAIEANGGAMGLKDLLKREQQEAKTAQAKADRIAQLKRIHGDDYSNKFDADGNSLKGRPQAAEADPTVMGPEQGPVSKDEHIARLKRIHGENYDRKFDADGVSRKESSKPYVESTTPDNAAATTSDAEQQRWDTFAQDNANTAPATSDGLRSNVRGIWPNWIRRPLGAILPERPTTFRAPSEIVASPEDDPQNAVTQEIGATAVAPAVEDQNGFFSRFRAGRRNQQNASRPNPRQPEMRSIEEIRRLTGADTRTPERRDQLLTEELNDQGIYKAEDVARAKAEIIAREQEGATPAAEAQASETGGLKDRAKNLGAKAKSKLRRSSRPAPTTRNLNEFFGRTESDEGAIDTLNRIMDDDDENN